jgi:hypothetical protein
VDGTRFGTPSLRSRSRIPHVRRDLDPVVRHEHAFIIDRVAVISAGISSIDPIWRRALPR